MEHDVCQGWVIPRPMPLLSINVCLQHRHDILLKFFGLMQEHHDDLSRLIVSPLII